MVEFPHPNNFHVVFDNEKQIEVHEIKRNEVAGMYVQKYLLEKDKILSNIFMKHLTDEQLRLFKERIEQEQERRLCCQPT